VYRLTTTAQPPKARAWRLRITCTTRGATNDCQMHQLPFDERAYDAFVTDIFNQNLKDCYRSHKEFLAESR